MKRYAITDTRTGEILDLTPLTRKLKPTSRRPVKRYKPRGSDGLTFIGLVFTLGLWIGIIVK